MWIYFFLFSHQRHLTCCTQLKGFLSGDAVRVNVGCSFLPFAFISVNVTSYNIGILSEMSRIYEQNGMLKASEIANNETQNETCHAFEIKLSHENVIGDQKFYSLSQANSVLSDMRHATRDYGHIRV